MRSLDRAGLRKSAIVCLLVWLSSNCSAQERSSASDVGSSQHPYVFYVRNDLEDIAARIKEPASFSAQAFRELAARVAHDLSSGRDWKSTYSGCEINVYLSAFSYEPQTPAMAEKLGAALGLSKATKPPAGASIVAARAALYAILVNAGAPASPNAPITSAISLAKTILLSWADAGFKGTDGNYLNMASQFCIDGKIDPVSETQVGLQVSRGVVYSVDAQDLLGAGGWLNADETGALDTFHASMFELIRNAMRYRFEEHKDLPCNYYSNHVGAQLTGLLAAARLLRDPKRVAAALSPGNSDEIAVSWKSYFDRAIYGRDQTPNACYQNSGADGYASRPFFGLDHVEPGEIEDRYRNENPLQGIGYPMGTLEWFYRSAEILRIAGFDAYAYRGSHGQSIEAATQFYACYGTSTGFNKTVTRTTAGSCPNFAQYDGKVVNGVDSNIVIGAYRFPGNRTITELEPSAKISARTRLTDPLLFGRWRD